MAITLEKRNPVNTVLIVILILVAAAAGYFYWSSTEAVKLRDQMSIRLDFLDQEKTRISAELNKTKSELADYQRRVETLTHDAAEAKKNQQIAEAELRRKVDEVSELQKRYEKRIQELENEVKQYADFNTLLTQSLEPIRAALGGPGMAAGMASMMDSVPDMGDKQAAVGPSVFSVASVERPDERVELATGQVISIDREYGFIVVNFGSASGVRQGSIVEIYDRDQLLGLGHAERVQDKIAAVSIVSEDLRSRIKRGDRAVLVS